MGWGVENAVPFQLMALPVSVTTTQKVGDAHETAGAGPPPAVEWSIDHDSVRGIYNVTSPNPATNRDFAHALGRALHRPSILPTPAFALRLALGSEMAGEMLLGGQRVLPNRATAEGFEFTYSRLDEALRHALSV